MMIGFLLNNWGTILIAVILMAVVSAIIINMYKDKKKGKSSCGCGCQNCPSADICHKV